MGDDPDLRVIPKKETFYKVQKMETKKNLFFGGVELGGGGEKGRREKKKKITNKMVCCLHKQTPIHYLSAFGTIC